MKTTKSAIVLMGVAAMAIVAGCRTLPTADKMQSVASAIGAAAGLVANETKIDDKSRNTIVAIMEEVVRVLPSQEQSFEEVWTPLAKEIVAKLVSDGKITEEIGTISLGAFGIAVKGIDYLFDVRYPKAKKYEELVSAAVNGFTGGFLAVFKPVNSEESKGLELKVDKKAYDWLKTKKQKNG